MSQHAALLTQLGRMMFGPAQPMMDEAFLAIARGEPEADLKLEAALVVGSYRASVGLMPMVGQPTTQGVINGLVGGIVAVMVMFEQLGNIRAKASPETDEWITRFVALVQQKPEDSQ